MALVFSKKWNGQKMQIGNTNHKKGQSNLCCFSSCFCFLLCTHYGPLQFQHIFLNQKKSECYGPLWLWLKQHHAKKQSVGFKGNSRTDLRKTWVRHIWQVANLSCYDYFDYPWRQVSVKLNTKNVGKTFTTINDLLKYTFCWSLASGFKK